MCFLKLLIFLHFLPVTSSVSKTCAYLALVYQSNFRQITASFSAGRP